MRNNLILRPDEMFSFKIGLPFVCLQGHIKFGNVNWTSWQCLWSIWEWIEAANMQGEFYIFIFLSWLFKILILWDVCLIPTVGNGRWVRKNLLWNAKHSSASAHVSIPPLSVKLAAYHLFGVRTYGNTQVFSLLCSTGKSGAFLNYLEVLFTSLQRWEQFISM